MLLSILTKVLHAAGVPPVVRDEFAVRSFPDDDYDVTPAAFCDLDHALHEPVLASGATTAHVQLARRQADRQR